MGDESQRRGVYAPPVKSAGGAAAPRPIWRSPVSITGPQVDWKLPGPCIRSRSKCAAAFRSPWRATRAPSATPHSNTARVGACFKCSSGRAAPTPPPRACKSTSACHERALRSLPGAGQSIERQSRRGAQEKRGPASKHRPPRPHNKIQLGREKKKRPWEPLCPEVRMIRWTKRRAHISQTRKSRKNEASRTSSMIERAPTPGAGKSAQSKQAANRPNSNHLNYIPLDFFLTRVHRGTPFSFSFR